MTILTQLDLDSVGRIAAVVRAVERSPRPAKPLVFPTILSSEGRGGSRGRAFRVCRFTGSWAKNTLKTVTFAYQTSTPNTASVSNLFANISVDCGERKCAIARDGTAWYLIQAEC